MRTLIPFLMFLSISCAYGASPEAAGLQPGQYITDKGWGTLDVKAGKDQTLGFQIETVGANLHTCELDGEIVGNRALLEGYEKGRQCTIDFQPSEKGINVVSGDQEACRDFCGMRAWFEGLYLKVPAKCENPARENTKALFKHLYDKKEYAEARSILEPLLKNCEKTMHWDELGSSRNDLAITQYHLGDYAACLRTLDHYVEDAAKKDEEVLENYPPADADTYSGILKAAKTNIGLCRSGLRKHKK